jgi:hypothetical protein
VIAVVAGAIVGIAFLLAGGTKLRAGPSWPDEAHEMGAPGWVVPVLPWFELVLGGLLVAQLGLPVTAVMALALLGAFTALIIRRLAQGRHPPCACFGAWSRRPLGWRHVVRNVVLMALALVAALGSGSTW